MSTPGAVACLFALVFAVQHYRQILWPLLEAAEQLAPLRRTVGLLLGTGGDRGHSVVRNARPELGGASAPWSEDELRPLSSVSPVPVSVSAREPPNFVAGPAVVVLSPD